MFAKTEMSEVLTEIVKMDPNFDREEFIKECQYEFIPNILEVGFKLKGILSSVGINHLKKTFLIK